MIKCLTSREFLKVKLKFLLNVDKFLLLGSLPQRVITCLMGFLAIVVGYGMRVCLTIAITEMVIPQKHSATKNHSFICPVAASSDEQTLRPSVVSDASSYSIY